MNYATNQTELFRRTREILNPDEARRETWLFIGVGSGGSRDAEEAARFGVGTMILCDRPGETLEEHNIIRHCLGYRDLGRLKIEALREHIHNINPASNVETVSLDVTKDQARLAELVARATQVHLCTDNERSAYAVNEVAVLAGVPLIFAGVFDGGSGGEVGRVMPGGACYACVAAYLNRSGQFDDKVQETFDYTSPQSPERSTAALNVDIAQIALLQARVGLLTMWGKQDPGSDLPGNYILFGNRPVAKLFPRMLWNDIWDIPKDPQCLVCSAATMSEAEIERAAEDILQNAFRRAG